MDLRVTMRHGRCCAIRARAACSVLRVVKGGLARAVRAGQRYQHQPARDRFVGRALAGGTDYPLTNDELERRDWYEAR